MFGLRHRQTGYHNVTLCTCFRQHRLHAVPYNLANSHIADLEQQLANQPVPVPVTTPPPDPKATEALAALVELAKALSLVA